MTSPAVKLVWITPNAEQLIAKIARVSNPANEDSSNIEGLLKFLVRNHHWSPFEMASACVEIHTTRDIAAQILRHRSFSFQEFSQRYAVVSAPAAAPDLRRQDTKNRQRSIDDLPSGVKDDFGRQISEHFGRSQEIYSAMIAAGVAKECARGVLPLSTPTRIYMSGTIRSWIHYVGLRGDPSHGAQKEHYEIARQVGKVLARELPVAMGLALPAPLPAPQAAQLPAPLPAPPV